MFQLVSNTIITNQKTGQSVTFKASSLKWKSNVHEYCDSAFITMPTICRLTRDGETYNELTSSVFTEGMKVEIQAGHNGNYTRRFLGFIKRINFKVPLEIECEGYSYPLHQVHLNKGFRNTTIRTILEEITQGTGIKLSPNIPEIKIDNLPAFGSTGIKVLEHIKDKKYLGIYFNFDTLYVGPIYTNIVTGGKITLANVPMHVQHRLGWNVIKDNELLFNTDKEFATVNYEGIGRLIDGKIVRTTPNYLAKKDNVKTFRIAGVTGQKEIDLISAERTYNQNIRGYEGAITTFLEPYAEKNWASIISDPQYPARSGSYYITGVEGSLSRQGGRQKVSIGSVLEAKKNGSTLD